MRERLAAASVGAALVATALLSIAPTAIAEELPESDGPSFAPALSADGRYVVFTSDASDLLADDPANDTNGTSDVFWVDTQTGTIRLVSATAGGASGNGESSDPDVSADGRFVAFQTVASDLVPGGDANGFASDILRWDSVDGSLLLVSRRGAAGVQGNDNSYAASISEDGSMVAFESSASNLIGTDSNNKSDVFVRDIDAGTNARASTNALGKQANGPSYAPVIAGAGGSVAFSSQASNLVSGDTNGARDAFWKNLGTGTVKRVSVSGGEKQAKGSSSLSDLSANGRFVVFQSYAANLVSGDDNNRGDVFLRDRTEGTTVRVSRNGATDANDQSFSGTIDATGTVVVFTTWATNLGGSDENGIASDLYAFEVATKTTFRVSRDADGGWPNGPSYDPALSSDGLSLALASGASDLVAADGNGAADVFVQAWDDAGRATGTLTRWSVPLPIG